MKTDKREALSKMVGLTVDEQRLCRIEGFKMAMRFLVSLPPTDDCDFWDPESMEPHFEKHARKRWGEAFDA